MPLTCCAILTLGVNDVQQGFTVKQSLQNIDNFNTYLKEHLPLTKLFLSLPLFKNGDPVANSSIADLRMAINTYVTEFNKRNPQPYKKQTLLINPNTNFMYDSQLIEEYYSRDGVHLSDRGKEVILGNFRHHIHTMTRAILNRPQKNEGRPRPHRRSRP